jgi:hypothetical protein
MMHSADRVQSECAVVAGHKPKDVPELQWINTVMGNLETSLSGSYHSFGFRKYAAQYLGTFAYRFNRRFDLKTLQGQSFRIPPEFRQ